ncbi:TetR/AcrR family transcriptional regulator C-terminal domain-containing protein [Devosia sp.]|uniref:TetR/AcrR family transcriptional regulator C-terminal domain-containing protein n=1 Tax=Devosia sp. TaxID=1871048 RepID=UPI002FCAB101
MALEPALIVAAALDLLDAEGLDGLTMRKLADALGVQAPSLYWYFPGKPALLDAMANALLEDVARTIDKSADFRLVLRQTSQELRRALLARRDGARVYAGTFVLGENVLRLAEANIGTLMAAGFDARTSMRTGFSLLYFVLGFVIEEQAWARETGTDPSIFATRLAQWGEGRFPAVEAALPHFAELGQEERFTFGLDLMLSGFGRPASGPDDKIEHFLKVWNTLR